MNKRRRRMLCWLPLALAVVVVVVVNRRAVQWKETNQFKRIRAAIWKPTSAGTEPVIFFLSFFLPAWLGNDNENSLNFRKQLRHSGRKKMNDLKNDDWGNIEIMPKYELKKYLAEGEINRLDVLRRLEQRLRDDELTLPFPRSDAYLIRFLRARNFDLDYALKLILNYEGLMAWKCRLSLSECQKLISQGAVQVLPKSDPVTGRKLVWLRPARWTPSVHDSDTFMRAGALSADALSLESAAQNSGIVVLFDLAEYGLAQLRALTPAIAKKLVHLLANCLPMRVHAVHLLNEPPFFSLIFTIYKKLLDDRMKKRLFIHGHNMVSLHKHISSRALPKELGGSAPPTDPSAWARAIGHHDVIKELRNFGYKFTDLS